MMRKELVRLFAIIFILSSFSAGAQNLTGIWRGYFYTEAGEQYKYEIQLKHTGRDLTGVSYSYLDTRFYGKATLAGQYSRPTHNSVVQELKTVEVKMSGSSVACIMRCELEYAKSGREEFLEGTFTSKYEKSNPVFGVIEGGNCGGGRVYLRKVPTSDFYPEPFLNKTPPPATKPAPRKTTPKTSAPAKTSPPKKITTPPAAKKTIPEKPSEPARPKVDTMAIPERSTPTFDNKNINKPISSTPLVTRSRKNELTKTFTIKSDEIEIRLYDNGEIDDDTVSVYLNGQMILANKRLSDKPMSYKLKMNRMLPEQTLVMVAENMGRIPPNTSLMIVQDGDRRYQVSITSTEQKNAMVRFLYDPD